MTHDPIIGSPFLDCTRLLRARIRDARDWGGPTPARTGDRGYGAPVTSQGLHARVIGDGPPILFVHGIGGSGRYWGTGFDHLAASHRLAFVDLAGFGRSISVPGPFGIDGHLARLDELRRRRLPGDLVIVGHSFGAALAFASSAVWPEVTGVLAVGLPAFRSPAEARAHVGNLGALARWMATEAWQARALCRAMCTVRPAVRLIAPLLAPGVPAHVARAGVEHTWPAYDASFRALVDDTDVRGWVGARAVPRRVLQGADDPVCPPEVVRAVLDGLPVELTVTAGDHHLPLHRPRECLEALTALLDPAAGR